MAYINAEDTAKIRKALKAEYPNLKFSVQNKNHSTVSVAILSGDIDFTDYLDGKEYSGVNHYHYDKDGEHAELFTRIFEIIKTAGKEWFDKSDAMTDYFHTAFYFDLSVGRWDKPYTCTKPVQEESPSPIDYSDGEVEALFKPETTEYTVVNNTLIQGDAMNPQDTDLIAQLASLDTGLPVPEGWRVMTGNNDYSLISRIAYRYEIEIKEPIKLQGLTAKGQQQ